MTALDKKNLAWSAEQRDPNGALFWHEGNVFRAMTRYDAAFYEGLLKTIDANQGLRNRLCPTTMADLEIEGAFAVLRHKVIEPKTLPYEWSPAMFRQAALCHFDLHLELLRHGYDLQDAHPWNVMFDGPSPVFVDYGSINPRQENSPLQTWLTPCFFKYWLNPLLLMAKGQAVRCRRYLTHSDPPLEIRDLRGYMRLGDRASYGALQLALTFEKHLSRLLQTGDMQALQKMRRRLETISAPPEVSIWRGYHDDEASRDEREWHDKQRQITELFSALKPKTVLDIGCATGWYSFAAARHGAKVIAIDVDDVIVDGVYNTALQEQLPITTAVKNVFQDAPENSKYRSEMVLALALVHHLVFSQHKTIPSICRTLANLSTKYLVVEFIGQGDQFVKSHLTSRPSRHDFYTLEGLVAALQNHFSRVSAHPSSSENRTLLVCEK